MGGLFGIPLGLWILAALDATVVCTLIGLVLLAYSAWSILKPSHVPKCSQSPYKSALVGVVGGLVGGFTAFPGCAPVIWAGLVGMEKTRQRTTVQPFILSMQVIALSILALTSPERFNAQFWLMFALLALIALPFTKLGVALFHRLSETNFKNATYGMLSVSGAALLAKGTPFFVKIAAKFQAMWILVFA
jgi:uncharacterized membrane protein YfcA